MKKPFLALSLFAISAVSLAAEPTAPGTQTNPGTKVAVAPGSVAQPAAKVTASVPAPASGSAIGVLDIRPSVLLEKVADPAGVKKSKAFIENSVEGGYKFSTSVSASYVQDFNTTIADPSGKDSAVFLKDGFFRAKFNDLYKDADSGLTLGFEPRFYTPTRAAARDAGMVTMVRNYFKLTRPITNAVSITLMEIPIFHVYTRSGSGASANPLFENRVYFITDVALMGGKLNLSLPILFHNTIHRSFAADAKLGGKWGHFLWVFPEVMYSLNNNVAVGVSYYSDNLIDEKLGGFTIGSGLSKGVAQAVLRASL